RKHLAISSVPVRGSLAATPGFRGWVRRRLRLGCRIFRSGLGGLFALCFTRLLHRWFGGEAALSIARLTLIVNRRRYLALALGLVEQVVVGLLGDLADAQPGLRLLLSRAIRNRIVLCHLPSLSEPPRPAPRDRAGT